MLKGKNGMRSKRQFKSGISRSALEGFENINREKFRLKHKEVLEIVVKFENLIIP